MNGFALCRSQTCTKANICLRFRLTSTSESKIGNFDMHGDLKCRVSIPKDRRNLILRSPIKRSYESSRVKPECKLKISSHCSKSLAMYSRWDACESCRFIKDSFK